MQFMLSYVQQMLFHVHESHVHAVYVTTLSAQDISFLVRVHVNVYYMFSACYPMFSTCYPMYGTQVGLSATAQYSI